MRISCREMLEQNKDRKLICAYGVYPGDFVIDMMHIAGVDCLIPDLEHQEMTYTELYQQMRVADSNGMSVMVRVSPGNAKEEISHVLDMGASGIMVPGINNRLEAEQVVDYVKFPPIGKRLGCCYTKGTGYGQNPEHCYEVANQESYIRIILQSWEAMDNLEDIFSVDLIDCITLGTGHLSILDIPGNYESPRIMAFTEKYLPLLRKYGKHGTAQAENRNPAAIAKYKDIPEIRWIKLTHAVGVISDAYIDFISGVNTALDQPKR